MKVAVVGSGIAGLSVATELSRHGSEVEILESADQFGGRAAVANGVEHCTRIMMDDYSELRQILDTVPSANPALSIWQTLVPVRRFVYLDGKGWRSLDTIYTLRGSGFSMRDRLCLSRARRRQPLLARESRVGPITALRMAAQMSPISWARVAAASLRVRGAHAFPGPTDAYLLDPWVEHLRSRGVELGVNVKIDRLRSRNGSPELHHSGTWHSYDAAVIAASLPDAKELLCASHVSHRLKVSDIALLNCASATFYIDPREDLATRHHEHDGETYLYSGGGFFALYQPRIRRVICVTTRPGPDASALLEATRRLLSLRQPVDLMGMRNNLEPRSRIFAATPLRPDCIASARGIYFVGAHLSRTYPLDSGEAAARSARTVARRLLARL